MYMTTNNKRLQPKPSMQTIVKLILSITIFAASSTAHARPLWHWEDSFSAEEKTQLKTWIEQASDGLEALLGPLQFDYRVYFHRSQNANEPVPWANTMKWVTRDVHFHVDMDYEMQEFKEDWTAPHEITHLVFPYLGDSGRWFAEGIASYFQYQVMYANNTISWDEAIRRYNDRFQKARAQGPQDLSITELSDVVSQTRSYVRMYWGGASYFMHVDQQLQEQQGLRLHDIISTYMNCCYEDGMGSAKQMIATLDTISNSTIFTDSYRATVMKKTFPKTNKLLVWLANNPPRLKFEEG